MLVEAGIVHYYIKRNEPIILVNRSITAQLDMSKYDTYDSDGAGVYDTKKAKRISNTTKRRRYKKNKLEAYNKDKGLLMSHQDIRTFT